MSGLRWKQMGHVLVLVGAVLWTSAPVAAQSAKASAETSNPEAIRGNEAARCGSCHESTSSSAGGDEPAAVAASIEFTELFLQGCDLRAEVEAGGLQGLSRPADHPQRTLWIEFVVRDASGETLFRSALAPSGEEDAETTPFQPHHTVITSEHQVQVYESVPARRGDPDPDPKSQRPSFVKDNRLLPTDLEARSPGSEIVPRGAAADDPDYRSTTDRVVYAIDLAGSVGPYEIEAVLHYQPVGPRWAEMLSGPPVAAGTSPRPLARVTGTVD